MASLGKMLGMAPGGMLAPPPTNPMAANGTNAMQGQLPGSGPTQPDDQMAYVMSLVQKAKSGQPLTPDEIAAIRQIMGDAPTEDSVGYWGGGQNGIGNRLVNMPGENGDDPVSHSLGPVPQVPLHRILRAVALLAAGTIVAAMISTFSPSPVLAAGACGPWEDMLVGAYKAEGQLPKVMAITGRGTLLIFLVNPEDKSYTLMIQPSEHTIFIGDQGQLWDDVPKEVIDNILAKAGVRRGT
jgi:hypothetical protein